MSGWVLATTIYVCVSVCVNISEVYPAIALYVYTCAYIQHNYNTITDHTIHVRLRWARHGTHTHTYIHITQSLTILFVSATQKIWQMALAYGMLVCLYVSFDENYSTLVCVRLLHRCACSVCVCMRACVYRCVCMHTIYMACIHACIHTHTHIHTHSTDRRRFSCAAAAKTRLISSYVWVCMYIYIYTQKYL
jgi:hypothetical protein